MVSIIVPVYNAEVYLGRCIDSILAQTFRDFELLLVENGSSDHSPEICKRYAKMDGRVTVLQLPEPGVSAARNAGLAKAGGEYISFVDADDWIAPSFYAELMRYMRKKHPDIVCCDYKIARQTSPGDPDQFTFEDAGTWPKAPRAFRVTGDAQYSAILPRSPYVWNKLFTREAIGRSRFRNDLAYGEDMIFLLDVLSRSAACGILNRPLYYYRKNRDGSITGASDTTRNYRYLLVLQEVRRKLAGTKAGAAGVCRLANGSMAVLRNYDYRAIPPVILDQVKQGIRAAGLRDRFAFFAGPAFSLKEKLLFLLLMINPRIAAMCRQAARSESRGTLLP